VSLFGWTGELSGEAALGDGCAEVGHVKRRSSLLRGGPGRSAISGGLEVLSAFSGEGW